MRPGQFVAVAGNIGVGKTHLTTLLANRLGWRAYYEPVIDNPYLDDFYGDMKRWAFHLQVYFLSKRFEIHRDMLTLDEPCIQDRTIYEDKEISRQRSSARASCPTGTTPTTWRSSTR